MDSDHRKLSTCNHEILSTGKKKLVLPFRIKVPSEKKCKTSPLKLNGKVVGPVRIKILEKMYPDEEKKDKSLTGPKLRKPPVRRKLINDTAKENNIELTKSASKIQHRVKPSSTTPFSHITRKSYFPQSKNVEKFQSFNKTISKLPNESSKKPVKHFEDEPKYSQKKLTHLKSYLENSIESMTAALKIVNELTSLESDDSNVISQSTQTCPEDYKSNINDLQDCNLNVKDHVRKASSDGEDSFLKMEHELNIVHDMKYQRKTIGPSLRELAILQSRNSISNTPQNFNLLHSKSVLNTPRTKISKSATKQLHHLLADSPFH